MLNNEDIVDMYDFNNKLYHRVYNIIIFYLHQCYIIQLAILSYLIRKVDYLIFSPILNLFC